MWASSLCFHRRLLGKNGDKKVESCVEALLASLPWSSAFLAAQPGEVALGGGMWRCPRACLSHSGLLDIEEFFMLINELSAQAFFCAVSLFNYLWSQMKTVVMAGLLLWYHNLHVLAKGIYLPRISLGFFFFLLFFFFAVGFFPAKAHIFPTDSFFSLLYIPQPKKPGRAMNQWKRVMVCTMFSLVEFIKKTMNLIH